jgi:hypothetical protein
VEGRKLADRTVDKVGLVSVRVVEKRDIRFHGQPDR